jgi:catechol 2,3-dioxygenase-like lactoylglutathione lyase family enzyme
MIKTGRVNHVALKITDVDRSREFYEKVVGLKKLPRQQINIPGEWYALGDGALHLIGGERKNDGRIDPTGPHIAVQVDSIDETKATLKEMGIEYLDATVLMAKMKLSPEQMKMVGRQVWVRDPDGNVLELQERIE